MSDNEIIKAFLFAPPNVVVDGQVKISFNSEKPTICCVCEKPAVRENGSFGGINVAFCDEHKHCTIAIGGGMPVQILGKGGQFLKEL